MPKKYVIVGTGGRAVMFVDAIAGPYKDNATLVGLCDLNPLRMDFYNEHVEKHHQHAPVPSYLADDFDRMIEEQKPDVVIVCTMDSEHHRYIIRAMELGCDAISEKPMTTDADNANAILDAIERTGRSLRVTFNYRYAPLTTKVREVIMEGAIGQPQAVDFAWVLDTSHGADYFRRWHREMDKSGGLLVHKATHHFDMVNWWIDGRPETVFAMGDLKFYGRENAESRGQTYDYDRYTGNVKPEDDPFALVLESTPDQPLSKLYVEGEAADGYVRDRNVFGDNISIYDTMAVMVKYDNGVVMNYSLLAYSPWEGFRVSITGTKGRMEIYEKHGSHIIMGQGDEELAAAQESGRNQYITLFPMFGRPYDVEIPAAKGGHGGGDSLICEEIFSADPPEDPFKRAASHIDGATSILVGISANESIRTGQPVRCEDLVPLG